LRRDVVALHTKEQWLERHAMVRERERRKRLAQRRFWPFSLSIVKVPSEGQRPAKSIPSKKKTDKTTELFGPWQGQSALLLLVLP